MNEQFVFILPYCTLSLLYFLTCLALLRGLRRAVTAGAKSDLPVSVIIPARNEADNIARCLDSIMRSAKDVSALEVIVVDDESTDGTGDAVAAWASGNETLPVTLVDSAKFDSNLKRGKKRALAAGISASTGEVLLFTDADCRVGPDWVGGMAGCFTPDVDVVAGFTFRDPGNSFAKKLYALESISTAAISAGSIGAGFPITASASNFAYRRSFYDRLGGFAGVEATASGDDTLMVQKAGSRAVYCAVPGTFNTTSVPGGLSDIIRQGRRKLAVTTRFQPMSMLLAAAVSLFYLLIMAYPFVIFLVPGVLVPLTAALFLKGLADFLVLRRFTKLVGKSRLLKYLPILELVYPVYLVGVGLLGLLFGSTWKARRT